MSLFMSLVTLVTFASRDENISLLSGKYMIGENSLVFFENKADEQA